MRTDSRVRPQSSLASPSAEQRALFDLGQLQWGRDPKTAERVRLRPLVPHEQVLQWGRDPKTAERRAGSVAFGWGSLGFNGAAIRRPRKAAKPAALRGPCLGFNGAAIRRPRKGRRSWRRGGRYEASMGPRSEDRGKRRPAATIAAVCEGFNGAAIRRPRKAGGQGADRHRGTASMGPRSEDRGKTAGVAGDSSSRHGFNGAAIRRPRKARVPLLGHGVAPLLQWGRDPKTAESRQPPNRWPPPPRASMGPRSEDRGKCLAAHQRN